MLTKLKTNDAQVRAQVCNQSDDQVYSQVWDHVWMQVRVPLCYQAWESNGEPIRDQIEESI